LLILRRTGFVTLDRLLKRLHANKAELKTCDKLGIAMWDYLGSRLKVAGHRLIQPLDHYVRGRFCPA
jgi:hypothetical protein